MDTLTTVICLLSASTFTILGITLLVSNISSFIEDRKRAKRDEEYHEARMKEFKK